MADQNVVDIDDKRDRSTIEFPYLDLDNAVDLAKGVHQGGGTCTKEQLAARFNQTATSGGFYQRITTAKMFGLLTQERGSSIGLSNLGMRICDPQQEKAARVEAFLTIPLYKALYDKFKGTTLPPQDGLEGAIGTLGVAPKQKDKARQAFQRSAKQAGFFEYGPEKLVLPATTVLPTVLHREKEHKPSGGEAVAFQSRNELLHPFIEGLLKTLPPAQTQWPVEARKKWLQTAESIFGLIYTD